MNDDDVPEKQPPLDPFPEVIYVRRFPDFDRDTVLSADRSPFAAYGDEEENAVYRLERIVRVKNETRIVE